MYLIAVPLECLVYFCIPALCLKWHCTSVVAAGTLYPETGCIMCWVGLLMADIREPVMLGIVWLDVCACLYFQVLEDNTGVRRVVVTPHSECFPPSYSPALSPSHHIHPPYLTHPHFIPASHTSYYPPVSPGDVSPHQYYQHRLPPIYPEGKASLHIAD